MANKNKEMTIGEAGRTILRTTSYGQPNNNSVGVPNSNSPTPTMDCNIANNDIKTQSYDSRLNERFNQYTVSDHDVEHQLIVGERFPSSQVE